MLSIALRTALVCACPEDAAVSNISTQNCIEQFGQIQKIGLQRRRNGLVENSLTISTDDPALLATWNSLKGAVDSTKVQFTPYLAAPNNDAGEPRTYGGGNQTVDGIPLILGKNSSAFTAEFLNMPSDIYEEIDSYSCGSQKAVYLLNEHGQIGGLVDDVSSPTIFKPIPIRSFYISDKVFGNFENPDKHMVQWAFPPNWSKKFAIITPSFDPLTTLS